MPAKYIFRIDDVSPEMNRDNFHKIEKIFDTYNIRPIIWVVPDNKDPKLEWHGKIADFRWKIKELSKKWRTIAQHGYQHVYVNKESGILGITKRSEFVGLPYDKQLDMLGKGKKILEDRLWIKIGRWMAPAHSFDMNTCKALKHLWFDHITDGVAVYPFTRYGFKRLPQQLWRPLKLCFGTRTIGLHLNTINQQQIARIKDFCETSKDSMGELSKTSYQTNLWKGLVNIVFKIRFFLALTIKYAYTKRGK